MAEQVTKIYLNPQDEVDQMMIRSVRAFGVRKMSSKLGMSHSWLCRILQGLGGIPGHKFNEAMNILRDDAVQRRKQDLMVKDQEEPNAPTP